MANIKTYINLFLTPLKRVWGILEPCLHIYSMTCQPHTQPLQLKNRVENNDK